MTFNNYTKEELNKMAKHSGINITYYDGYILEFDKVNVHAITPHKLVFSKNGDFLSRNTPTIRPLFARPSGRRRAQGQVW